MARILVVDDSELSLAVVQRALSLRGHEVVTCSNALLVAGELRRQPFDLLLLDVEMPAIRAPDVVAALRRSDVLRATKVVLFSSHANLAELARSCGAAGWVPKGLSSAELARRVESLLRPGESSGRWRLGKSALVVVRRAALERAVVSGLERVFGQVQARPAADLEATLRAGGHDLLVLDADAVDQVDRTLDQLQEAGALARVAVLVVGASKLAHACLSADDVVGPGLIRACLAALGNAGESA